MNICLLTKTTLAHGLGGVEVHVETLARVVPALGHRLTIIASRHPEGLAREERQGCSVHYAKEGRPARYDAAFFRAVWNKLIELHRRDPFDAVWAEDFAAYGCLEGDGLPPVLSVMQGSGLRGLIWSEWNRTNSVREMFMFCFKFFPEAIIFYSFWYWRTLRKSGAVAAVSRETAEDYRRDHGVPRRKIHVVFNSVDTDRFSPRADLRRELRMARGLGDEEVVVLMAAVVHKQKGMHRGLEAFLEIATRFPNARLWVAGAGPHLDELKSQAEKYGLSGRVDFFGPVANDAMPAYYNAADVFLNPTLRFEGLTITTVEAMSCGLPVVISRIGGTPSTIEEGVSGFFVPPDRAEPLRDRLARLLADPELRKSMGKAARERALERFHQEKMVRTFVAISESLRTGKIHV